ncbi:MAG: tRNA 4-thiouridine(8) synthase ThiI [Clostridiales bacterium]|nr:tRNA 4-thiouridine(8) synthase ThiI [Clostridiales bacterium]
MKKVILIRYSEIHLKGNNKRFFEKLLLTNIKEALKDITCNISFSHTRYLVTDFEEEKLNEILSLLLTVFGIHSLSVADEIETSVENIENYFKNFKLSNTTFRVSVNRADKSFPINSTEFSKQIGSIIFENNENLTVDLHNYKNEISIDIRETGKTYIFTKNIKALNGMPVGSAGKGLLLLSGGLDSPVAGYKIAQRGMIVDGLHFHSFPYTSENAKNKVIKLAKLIKPYTHLKKLFVVSFTKIQEEIHKNCDGDFMITLMRRIMMRIAERLCEKYEYKTIITGECLGQVASQTIESLTSTNLVLEKIPVLRPLIAFDKDETIEIAHKINTYETSILPFEDCCTVFLPKNPVIKPKIDKVLLEESKLNIEELINDAIKNLEVVEV